MKKILLVLSALLAFGSITAFAEDALPEIAPVDEAAAPPLDAAAPAEEPAPSDGK